jgi:hypothetical protein
VDLNVPFEAAENAILLADGDRDHMSGSRLTVEQSLAVLALMRDMKFRIDRAEQQIDYGQQSEALRILRGEKP